MSLYSSRKQNEDEPCVRALYEWVLVQACESSRVCLPVSSACPLSLIMCPLPYPSFPYLVLMLVFDCLVCEMGFDSRTLADLELKILLPPVECWDCWKELPCLAFFAFASLFLILLPQMSYRLCFGLSLFSLSLITHFFLDDLCLILTSMFMWILI